MGDIHANLKERIERAYSKSRNQLGWRLLASPESVLEGADIALIDMHPGGSVRPPDHPEFAMPSGSAYIVESWDGRPPGCSPLQAQVQTLFEGLGASPETVLAGHLIPFRSPDWKSLPDKRAALRFGEILWEEILTSARPKLVIAMGLPIRDVLHRVLGARDEVSVPVRWGNVTGSRAVFDGGILVGLPHLSRFGIMRRPQSAEALRTLFDGFWRL